MDATLEGLLLRQLIETIEIVFPLARSGRNEDKMCTGIRFSDADGNMYMGRNLDWTIDYGQKVYATQRGFKHPKFMDGNLESKYATIGTAIVVEDCPLYFDVANEKGLGCAGLNFPGYATYADPAKLASGKTGVPSYIFPFYVVSQFETVDEAEAALANIEITNIPFSAQLEASLLHWIIGDGKRAIVVEQMADGLHIYHDDIDVLANQPTFDYQQENLRNYMNVTPTTPQEVSWGKLTLAPFDNGQGMCGLPGGFYSTDRFVRAAYLNSHYPEQKGELDNVTRLMRTLLGVAQVPGAAMGADGSCELTVYSGGFSSATNSYYYFGYYDPTIKRYCLDDVAADGGKVVEVPASAFPTK